MTPDAIEIAAAVRSLKALANPARLRIALHLLGGEAAVAELEAALGLKQPNLSQYLAELREAGLVATRREARSVFYTLADARAEALLLALSAAAPGHFGHALPAARRPMVRRPGAPVAAAAFATVGSGRPVP